MRDWSERQSKATAQPARLVSAGHQLSDTTQQSHFWCTCSGPPPDMFFGGGRGGRQKGPDAHVEIPVTLEELYNGGTRSAR